MSLPNFDVLVPDSIEETCSFLAEKQSDGVRILAGGTDVLVDLKQPVVQSTLYTQAAGGPDNSQILTTSDEHQSDGQIWAEKERNEPSFLVSLHKLKELKQIEILDDGRLRVGALTTARELQREPHLRESWGALAEGADALGSPLVRARGTLGGNICNARPAADMLVPSICLGADLQLQSNRGTRTVRADEFVTGPGRTIIQLDEFLTYITFPAPGSNSGSAYYKLAQRKALDISVVGVASSISLNQSGDVTDVRVTMGAVGPKPLLAQSVHGVLIGKIPTDELIDKAALGASLDATPIDDHRGTLEYRRQMVEVLTARTLRLAIQRAEVLR
jgi:aerobic carbon-monoxide dehydrogenase medium subunit